MLRLILLAGLLFIVVMACSREPETPAATASEKAPLPVNDPRPVILAFGDSLTAGHGVELPESYPSLLQKELDRRGFKYSVVNAGISGDTTSGGLARIDGALAVHP